MCFGYVIYYKYKQDTVFEIQLTLVDMNKKK